MQDFIFPLFKFSKKIYINNLLKNGEIKIGTLYDYRDYEKYKGNISDEDEGRKQIRIYFDNVTFEGVNGTELSDLGFHISNANVKLVNTSFQFNMDSPNCYIYSTSSLFFSDTLNQAIEDGYDSCAIITDPDMFFSEINKVFDKGKALGYYSCIYGDRNIKLDWKKDRDYINIIKKIPASIIKAFRYKTQREVRGLWLPDHQDIKPKIIEVNTLPDYVKKVNFDNLDIEVIQNHLENYKVGVNIEKYGDKENSVFSIEYPNELFTPVIFKEESKKYIGFKSIPSNHEYKNPYIENAYIGLAFTEIGSIFCVNPLDEISRLEYFTEKI